jgi:hypothetical protein
MSAAEQADLQMYLKRELEEAMPEHLDREQRLKSWDDAYIGDAKQTKRNFPWPGAANIEIPLIGIHVDSIIARVVNTMFDVNPFYTINPLHKGVEPMAKPLQDYMEWSRKTEFNLYKTVRTNVSELVKFGWSWYKPCWELYRRPYYKVGPNGQSVLVDEVIRRPNVYHILNRDVINQCGVEDYEQAEWICHRVRLTDNEVRLRVRDNIYDLDLEKVLRTKEDAMDHHEAMRNSRTDSWVQNEKFNTFYEFWMDWPWKNNIPVPMVVVYHKESNKICRAVFNPYGFRPFRKSKFIEREGRAEGIGIARRLYQMQEEISTVHRQQIDNSTLANTRFFVGRKGAIRAGTQIWPGRVLLTGDPKSDLIPYQMGDIYQSQGVLEMRALSYAERASGVSDYQLGRESSVAGSGATATSTLALIQEGNRRFDLNIRDTREVLGQVGRDIILLNQMYRPSGFAFFVQGQDGQFTEMALNMPPEFAAARMAVELTASTATINKEVEKQSLLALMGIVDGYYQKVIQAGMIMANPQVPGEIKEFIMKATEGAKYTMEQVVRTFNVKSIDKIVPGLMPNGNDQGPAGPGDSADAGSPFGAQELQGMGGVPQLPGGPTQPSAA